MEIGLFAFYSEHYFYCMFIEKPCIFSKLVQLTMSVNHIVKRNFVKIFISENMKSMRAIIFKTGLTVCHLTLFHSERPKLFIILAFLSAIGLNV